MNKKIRAYVIMPYGGADEQLRKEYNNIFRFLIHSALTSYDPNIVPIRQDYTGEGGHIIDNVIQNLGTDELVIADLSSLNWNVAYELGIRHSLSKSHTVLICNDETEIPFDIRSLNIIIYSRKDWMGQIDDIESRLVQAIRNTMETDRCDSPVHSCFTALPENVAGMLGNTNDVEQKRIAELTVKNQALTAEIDQLKARLESAGLNATSSGSAKVNLESLFVEAARNRNLVSDTAVDHLRELADEKKYEEFARFLAEVLDRGYLDEVDCRNVYIICRRLGIPEITKQYIQIAVTFYPDNEELQGFLASEYSNDYREKDRAQTIANDMLGLKRVGGKFELLPKVRSSRMMASFFDVYLSLKKYQEIIDVGILLYKNTSSNHTLILRNISHAARHLERYDLAYASVSHALHRDPVVVSLHNALYLYHCSRNDMQAALTSLENALCCDVEEVDTYFRIAGFICDELYARTDNGRIEPISARDKERYVVPYILQAFMVDRSCIERAITFLKKNKITNFVPSLIALYKKEVDVEDLFAEWNMDAVLYCYKKQDKMLAEIEAMPDTFEQFL